MKRKLGLGDENVYPVRHLFRFHESHKRIAWLNEKQMVGKKASICFGDFFGFGFQ